MVAKAVAGITAANISPDFSLWLLSALAFLPANKNTKKNIPSMLRTIDLFTQTNFILADKGERADFFWPTADAEFQRELSHAARLRDAEEMSHAGGWG